jgi:hypothetical protein
MKRTGFPGNLRLNADFHHFSPACFTVIVNEIDNEPS